MKQKAISTLFWGSLFLILILFEMLFRNTCWEAFRTDRKAVEKLLGLVNRSGPPLQLWCTVLRQQLCRLFEVGCSDKIPWSGWSVQFFRLQLPQVHAAIPTSVVIISHGEVRVTQVSFFVWCVCVRVCVFVIGGLCVCVFICTRSCVCVCRYCVAVFTGLYGSRLVRTVFLNNLYMEGLVMPSAPVSRPSIVFLPCLGGEQYYQDGSGSHFACIFAA